MPTKQQDEQHADEKPERSQRDAAIGRRVMRALGQPGDLLEVQVRPLWGDHYRVNVLVGAGAASAKIAHSYFLVADGQGNVLACAPTLTRQYGPVAEGAAGPSPA
jgi:hypothetical protein